MRRSFLPVLLCLFCFSTIAQKVELLTTGTATSIRGMSVVNDKLVWVSGSGGMVGKSLDGGATWQWTTVPGFEKREFRDIEAFDEQTAIVIAIAEPAQILKTTDGGAHWNIVFTDSTKGMFLDAMDFADKRNGIVAGDPVDGKFYLLTTSDKGDHWQLMSAILRPDAAPGEACFAASGTNILYFKNKDFLLVSGGLQSRLHDDAGSRSLPLLQGREMTGANSIATPSKGRSSSRRFFIAAGDYEHQQDTTGNCILTNDGGATWQYPAVPPDGYRSCVAYITAKKMVTCGMPGVDISVDGGMHWQKISAEGFHVCQKSKRGKAVYFAGSKGRIAKLVW